MLAVGQSWNGLDYLFQVAIDQVLRFGCRPICTRACGHIFRGISSFTSDCVHLCKNARTRLPETPVVIGEIRPEAGLFAVRTARAA